jgi:hypothetical protein
VNPVFCTLFDRNYLLKGVVMARTLARHSPDSRLFVLCMDDETFDLLSRLSLPRVELLRLREVEDEDLLRVKPRRSIAEYYWTFSPCLPLHLLNTRPTIDAITYLDADLMFFSSPGPIFDEIADASIAIIGHRYTERLAHLEVYGRFNVQWVGFRRDEEGLACLKRWREQCIDWCFSYFDGDRLGDQKYLDAWPDRYRSVHVIQHPGAGVGPWNFPRYSISSSNGRVSVDGQPLIFYHYHQLQILKGMRFDRLAAVYTQDGPAPAGLYEPYERALRDALRDVRRLEPGFDGGIRPWLPVLARRVVQNLLPVKLKSALRRVVKP